MGRAKANTRTPAIVMEGLEGALVRLDNVANSRGAFDTQLLLALGEIQDAVVAAASVDDQWLMDSVLVAYAVTYGVFHS
jgi:hypothetical protein